MESKTFDTAEHKFLSSRFAWNNDKNQFKMNIEESVTEVARRKFNNKIINGEYLFEDVPCFCNSSSAVLISQVDRYGFYYPLVICKKCGLIRANPRMNKEAYIKFYANDYRNVYDEGSISIDKLFNLRLKQGREMYTYLTKLISLPTNAVIFEIGCDFGATLLAFADKGYNVYGCDYGIEHIEYGRKITGLETLFIGDTESFKKVNKKADLVILNHVFEHFLDLEMELKTIREIIRPDAFIFISIPGILWWIKNICSNNIMSLIQNAHTYQFSLRSLTYVMECCGFKLIYGNEKIEAIFKINNIFRDKNNLPKNEFKRIFTYLKTTERNYLIKSKLRLIFIKLLKVVGMKDIMKDILRLLNRP